MVNLLGIISILFSLVICGCASTQQSRLIAYNSGESNNSWDKLLISKVDGRFLKPPKETVALNEGKRTVTFSLSYMRGEPEHPILVDVPVTGYFSKNTTYTAFVYYESGFMGVTIQTGHTITAGALVYSAAFEAYGIELRKRDKARR